MPGLLIHMIFGYRRRHINDIRIIAIIYFVQFCLILPYFYWNVPWTAYFKLYSSKNLDYDNLEKIHNQKRVLEAKQYFNQLESSASLQWYHDVINNTTEQLDFVVAIVTAKRKLPTLGYLLQSTAQLDKLVKLRKTTNNIFTFVCNVDIDPGQHDDANYIKSYLPFVERFGDSKPNIKELYLPHSNISYRQKPESQSSFEKETVDYIYCLNAAKQWQSKYIMVVEDDAVVHDNIFEVISYSLKYSLGNVRSFQNVSERQWTYLKLYYPNKWQGFGFEFLRIMELLAMGSIGASFFNLLFYLLRNFYRVYSLNLFFISGFIFTILSCTLLGRQNILQCRTLLPALYSFVPSPGCCTPVMLYPTDTNIMDNLSLSLYQDAGKHKMKVDLALSRFVSKSGIPAYHVVPNLANHIGRITSLSKSIAHEAGEFV